MGKPGGAVARGVEACRELLSEHGLLLVQDPHLPSVAGHLAGEPIRGSWWGHPEGSRIFHVLEALGEDEAILWTKLVSGKVTLVHRRLGPAFLAVATERAAWQTRGLPAGALAMLQALEADGEVPVDRFPVPSGETATKAASLLEERLLAASRQEHAEGGKHVRILVPWEAFRRRDPGSEVLPPPGEARRTLETILAGLNAATGGKGRLPWEPRETGRGRQPQSKARRSPGTPK